LSLIAIDVETNTDKEFDYVYYVEISRTFVFDPVSYESQVLQGSLVSVSERPENITLSGCSSFTIARSTA